jgi:predicted MPP superfamily phosphohydrolase
MSLLGESKAQRPGAGSFHRAFRRAVAYWRAIVLLLVVAGSALVLEPSDLIVLVLFVIFIVGQLFWIGRILDLGQRLIPGKPRRAWLAIIAGLFYLFVLLYSYPRMSSAFHVFRAADYRLHSTLIEAAVWWWFVGSLLAFAFVIAFGMVDRCARASAWMYRRGRERTPAQAAPDPELPGPLLLTRRRFLGQTTTLVSAAPFAAVGYGLLHGRLDVEVVRRRIRLARLPRAFEGFQIAQLSDVHIGPFTTADFIRRCVAMTNELKPDLIALTGDYIAWDPQAEGEVVQALAGLRAPCGVFGCLGNHEEEGGIEESITRLFAAQGVHILREERAAIRLAGATFNLIGIAEPRGRDAAEWRRDRERRLQQIGELARPDTVNVLLSHSPDPRVFDRAAEVGIDLMLAGHTHGGQLSLDSLSHGLNLSRLIYRYNNGWYEKHRAQLYVNRGIGTTGFPIRLGARPEITVLELAGA